MSITRAPRPESNFYILDKRISEDQRLSWGARGLLIFLLGKPDSWTVSINHLRDETKNSAKPTGRDGVYGLLDELIQAGYVIRSQERQGSGGFSSNAYTVRESPLPDLPYTGLPDTANPTLVSIDLDLGLNKTKPLSLDVTDEGKKGKAEQIPYDKIMGIYNETLGDIFKHAISMDAKRISNVKKCWALKIDGSYPFRSGEFWKAYFSTFRSNMFLRGDNDRGWKAHFEYVTRPAIVTAALEELCNATS